MNDIKIVVGILLGAVLFPYLTIMLAIMSYERRSCKKMEEAMIKEKYVKHGCWVSVDAELHYCSACNHDSYFVDRARTPYCPWCGAKMDGDYDE